MKLLHGAVLAVLLFGLSPGSQANNAPTLPLDKALGECIDSRFSRGEASNINDEFLLDEDCPALFKLLKKNPALQLLDPPLENTTSLNQLLDTRFLLSANNNPVDAIYTVADKAFLQQLAVASDFETSPLELGLWERFKNWIKEHYKKDDESETDWGWLLDLLDKGRMPEWLGKVVYYTSIGLIILLAGMIVFNELRAARRGGRRKPHRSLATQDNWEAGLATLESLNWEAIGKLPAQHQPGAMLRFVIDQLIERGWISDNRSRTNREMWRELRREHADSAGQFDRAVSLAEQSVYGEQQLDDSQLTALYETAQRLAGQADTKPGEKPE